ncbi:hypothetical protein HC251_11385 [Iamia sp. SCSIO 61187]|uniref:hypothetical protein n=1 Tax=Iamia sp. SCSIO 61187 TaxID=2722752 RepID=UPI001C633CED|nr:hypothetical protein [Iamia sp. SCSIO 61187]QYG92974.1 hypothetical protein HC251_11385 [Iamia sp. SCSIO 61187]
MTAGLVVTSDADLVKRAVGPTAWLVFEHLALAADDDLESSATARSIGVAVSVSKDTAAAAIRRLAALGLVARRPQARRHGRFGAASLRVALPAGVTLASTDPTSTPMPTTRRPLRPRPEPSALEPVEQLSLIPAAEPAEAGSPCPDPKREDVTHTAPSPDRRAIHEFASSDAALERERQGEHEDGSSC